MKFIIAESKYNFVEEVLIPLDEIAVLELREDKVVVYTKHGNECYYIDKETYYNLKSNPSK